jgi:amino acid transporter
MARKGLFPAAATKVQSRFATPYIAVTVVVAAMLAVALAMYFAGVTPINIFNYCGTLSSFGFIVIYAFIAVAAPLFLKRIGDHRAIDYVVAALALICLLVPAVTLFVPAPPPPTNAFAYIFLVYMLAGWIYFSRPATAARKPTP